MELFETSIYDVLAYCGKFGFHWPIFSDIPAPHET